MRVQYIIRMTLMLIWAISKLQASSSETNLTCGDSWQMIAIYSFPRIRCMCVSIGCETLSSRKRSVSKFQRWNSTRLLHALMDWGFLISSILFLREASKTICHPKLEVKRIEKLSDVGCACWLVIWIMRASGHWFKKPGWIGGKIRPTVVQNRLQICCEWNIPYSECTVKR